MFAILFCAPSDSSLTDIRQGTIMSIRTPRNQDRKNKRLKVRFGVEGTDRVAYLGNFSLEGAHIITGQPEKVGTLLHLRIYLPDEQEIRVEGRVRWARKIPPHLIRLSNNAGMGVKFTRFETDRALLADYLSTLRY